MPRSGHVLYTNVLWVEVKRRFGLADTVDTLHHFNHLFDPDQRDLPDSHGVRLLRHCARSGRRDPGPCRSFVNLAFADDEGDVFGNVLVVLCGAASESRGHAIVKTIAAANADEPYRVRVVLHALSRGHELWRPCMARHQQSRVYQYHNGGIWPFVGGFCVLALARLGLQGAGWPALGRLTQANAEAKAEGPSPSGSKTARRRPWAWPGRAGARRPMCSRCACCGKGRWQVTPLRGG
ncbi:MAG: hypothetical protein C0505_14800 [Leptothrix sp. (in: Bacteria)]|nr:hypothetical protein [Leptothrix sp. (in: b-proteobacteria)]